MLGHRFVPLWQAGAASSFSQHLVHGYRLIDAKKNKFNFVLCFPHEFDHPVPLAARRAGRRFPVPVAGRRCFQH